MTVQRTVLVAKSSFNEYTVLGLFSNFTLLIFVSAMFWNVSNLESANDISYTAFLTQLSFCSYALRRYFKPKIQSSWVEHLQTLKSKGILIVRFVFLEFYSFSLPKNVALGNLRDCSEFLFINLFLVEFF